MTAQRGRSVLGSLSRNRWLRRGAAAMAFTGVRRRDIGGRAPHHLLVAPPGNGNIGDQALIESFLENVPGRVTILTRTPNDVTITASDADRVSLLALPSLVYGRVLGHARDMRRFARLLSTATSLSIVGADVMDGAYVLGASVSRADIAFRAARVGVPSRVLGFSWNEAPAPPAQAALRRAEAAGVRLFLRDPLSADRASRDGLRNTLTADIVFAARSVSDELVEAVRHRLGNRGRPYAIVNASGLVGGSQIEEYSQIVRELRRRELDVVVVPHVSRAGADDLPLCRTIVESADDEAVVLVDHLATPAEVRGLARHATVTVTGRMHLAVMSLMAGIPALTVATQGKVEGLMRSLDADDLCIPSGPGLGARVAAGLAELESNPGIRRSIARHLPEIQQRAAVNFDGLTAASVVAGR